MSNTGEAHFANPALTNSPYTTNRILEIPQDIKLELSNGTLTLKAGSKVYVPNGFEANGTTLKFDVVTIESDLTSTNTNNSTRMVFLNDTHANINWRLPLDLCYSGNTAPTVSSYGIWYDTANNLLKFTSNGGSTWTSGGSLPLFIGTASSTQWTSIDRVFNGFGYIGSTVFVLPGVKLQIPNDRNVDGSYINNIATIPSVNINTTNQNGLCQFVCTDTGSIAIGSNYVYDDTKNLLKRLSDGVYFSRFILADVLYEGGKVTQFTPYNVDSIANSNASNFSQAGKSLLSGLGMPDIANAQLVSNSFATNTKFTAPANGWYCCRGVSSAAGHLTIFMTSLNANNGVVAPYVGGASYVTTAGAGKNEILPVLKSTKIEVQHNNCNLSGDAYCGLWFIPAKGEN